MLGPVTLLALFLACIPTHNEELMPFFVPPETSNLELYSSPRLGALI